MHRSLRSAALAFALAAPLAGCSPAVINAGGDGAAAPVRRSAAPVAVRIVDPGMIYSDYDLRNDRDAESEVRSQGISDAQWQDIVRLGNEAAWPSALQDIAGRARMRREIRSLRATRVAAFRDKLILFVPAEQPGLPADAQGTAYYVVIGQSGVSIGE